MKFVGKVKLTHNINFCFFTFKDSFMTTYYQPQPQTSQQPPPRRVNLAIPIVAPPEHGVSKSSPIPAQTTSSTN